MNEPVINILTRASRKEAVIDCINSVRGQTYQNYNHIITYETEEFKKHLLEHIDSNRTILCRVNKVKSVKNLRIGFWYKDGMDVNNIDFYLTGDRADSWFADAGGAQVVFTQFTPNLYLLKAERYIEDGWIIYLDDECMLYNENALKILADNIKKHNIDTLHWLYANNKEGIELPYGVDEYIYEKYDRPDIIPIVGIMKFMGSGGYPPLSTFGSSNYCFHSKYLPYTRWTGWRGDDWQTAVSLYQNIKGINIVKEQPIINIFNSD